MRRIVSVVLATALVTTPLKLVLAQAQQQQDAAVQPIDTVQTVIGVPEFEPASPATLLLAPAALTVNPARDSLPLFSPPPMPGAVKTGLIVLAVLGLAVLAFYIIECRDGCLG